MTVRFGWSLVTLVVACAELAGCSTSDSFGEVGFILRRATEQSSSIGLRESVVDRPTVVNATCEILDSAKAPIRSESVPVDPAPAVGYQDVRLKEVPAGTGYYARFLGFNTDNQVHQCGVTGPFTLVAGKKLWLTIFIDYPLLGDSGCDKFCDKAQACEAGWYCSSPCTDQNYLPEQLTCAADTYCCTNATCRLRIGEPCTQDEQCGGMPFACDTTQTSGYCTRDCGADEDCPSGSFCDSIDTKKCVRECAQLRDCRTGYDCGDFQALQHKGGCVPNP